MTGRLKRSGFVTGVVFVLCVLLPFRAEAATTLPGPDVVAGTAVDTAGLAGVLGTGPVAAGLMGLAGVASWLNHDTAISTTADTGPAGGGLAVNGYPSSQLVAYLNTVTLFKQCGSCTSYYPVAPPGGTLGGRAYGASDVLWSSSIYAGGYGQIELGMMKVCKASGPFSQDGLGCQGGAGTVMAFPFMYQPAQTIGGTRPGGSNPCSLTATADWTLTDASGTVTYNTTGGSFSWSTYCSSARPADPQGFTWHSDDSLPTDPHPLLGGGTSSLTNITLQTVWGSSSTQVTAPSETSLVMAGGKFLQVDVLCNNNTTGATQDLIGYSDPLVNAVVGHVPVKSCAAHNGASWSPKKVTVSYVDSSGTKTASNTITYPAPSGTTAPIPGTAGQTVISYDPTTNVSVTTPTQTDSSPQVIPPPVMQPNGSVLTNLGNCLDQMSLFNPISWVEKPVECALTAAFVPTTMPNLTLSGTHPQMDKWALPTPTNLWPGEGGCGGITVTLGHKYFNDYSTTYLNTCNAPYSTIRGWVYSLSMVGVLMYGVWTAYGLLTSGLGVRQWDMGPDGSGQLGFW